MSFQNVFIVGASGKVGRELVNQIRTFDGTNHEHKNPTIIAGIANSTNFILNPSGVALPEHITRDSMGELLGLERNGSASYNSHQDILDAVKKTGMDGDIIFIDVTADDTAMTQFHSDVIGKTGNRIVTANKKPAAADMKTFELLTGNPHRYRYNTTVMAGAGAVPYFQEAHGLSEEILSVEGTFSGTLAYVCSELEKGEKTFSQIVKEAQEKGYTEPHPIDDLNGEDVKRKLLILLRSAGIRIEEVDIELSGLVESSKYEGLNESQFLEAIRSEDANMEQSVREARERGLVPRFIASYSNNDGITKAQVGLQFIPRDSQIGQLKGTANKILIHTSQRTPLGSAPHEITSPGAGTVKTAASVRADLLYLLNGTNLWQHA